MSSRRASPRRPPAARDWRTAVLGLLCATLLLLAHAAATAAQPLIPPGSAAAAATADAALAPHPRILRILQRVRRSGVLPSATDAAASAPARGRAPSPPSDLDVGARGRRPTMESLADSSSAPESAPPSVSDPSRGETLRGRGLGPIRHDAALDTAESPGTHHTSQSTTRGRRRRQSGPSSAASSRLRGSHHRSYSTATEILKDHLNRVAKTWNFAPADASSAAKETKPGYLDYVPAAARIPRGVLQNAAPDVDVRRQGDLDVDAGEVGVRPPYLHALLKNAKTDEVARLFAPQSVHAAYTDDVALATSAYRAAAIELVALRQIQMIPALRMHVPALIAAVDESHAFGSVQAAANPVTHEYAMDMCQLLRLVHRFHEHGWYHGAIRPAALFAGNVRSRSASSSASMPAASDFGTETDSEAAASAVAAEAATSKDVRFGAEIEDDETTEAVTESESEAEWASMPGQLRSQVQDPITDYTSVLGLWNRARYVPAHDVRKAKGKSQHQAEHQTVHPDEGKGKQKATGPTFDYDPERPWISFDGMADSRDVDDLMWRYLPADLWYGSREISLKRLDAYGLGQLFFERINERPMYDFEPHFLKLIETIVKTAPSRQETKRTTFDEAVPWYEKLGELKPGREGLAERLSRVTGVVDSQHKYYIRLPIQTEPGDPISHVEAIIRHQTPRTNKGGFAIITYSHLFKAADTGADFLQACSRKVAKGVNKFLSRSPRKTADGRESESEEEPSQSQQATRALSVAAGHKRMVMAWLANKPSSTVPWMTKMEFKMIRSLLDINSDRSLAEEADHFQCPPLHPSLAHDPPSFR